MSVFLNYHIDSTVDDKGIYCLNEEAKQKRYRYTMMYDQEQERLFYDESLPKREIDKHVSAYVSPERASRYPFMPNERVVFNGLEYYPLYGTGIVFNDKVQSLGAYHASTDTTYGNTKGKIWAAGAIRAKDVTHLRRGKISKRNEK